MFQTDDLLYLFLGESLSFPVGSRHLPVFVQLDVEKGVRQTGQTQLLLVWPQLLGQVSQVHPADRLDTVLAVQLRNVFLYVDTHFDKLQKQRGLL